ncbi:acetyl-CoA C-acetyltransferase [Embleya sp. NPDC050154]|uniref:acetyl-CoA C-acetyltransferase n=1 Tax=Embleya sp. NPDC050154 TaxID=3363988 RepID=UPI00379E5FA9
MSNEAYIVDAIRTPVGRRNGGLAKVHPADLGAHVLRGLIDGTGLDPAAVDDVIFGCLDVIGPQAGNVARTSWLSAGLPTSVPGTTIDRQCGSSQQAVHFAAQAVLSGTADVVVAGGVQNMSAVPISASLRAGREFGFETPYDGAQGWRDRFGDQEITQFRAAELIAERWGLTREEMETFAITSHERALRAQREGRFANEIVPYGEVTRDEGPREPDLAKIRSLPTLRPDGRITAALASQISDGASAALVVSERALRVHGLHPRARIHHLTVLGDDPVMMLTGPIPATARALERTGLSLDDIDRVEINEAFASVVLAWQRATGADPERVNVNGGAIALGHPLGASGTKLLATLLNELERSNGRYGLQTMCEGGGMANVTIIERLT